jgi:hypothetical protein
MQTGSFTIELTSDEAEIANSINFNPLGILNNIPAFHANGELAAKLITSLLERNAIPTQRAKYFADPSYNVGGSGKSRQERFLYRTGSFEKMLRHGHFLKHLHYFIHGPNLPAPVLVAFRKAVEECGQITSGDIAPLSAIAKHLARTHRIDPKFGADEFFKLSLELKLDIIDALSIRSAVIKIRPAFK